MTQFLISVALERLAPAGRLLLVGDDEQLEPIWKLPREGPSPCPDAGFVELESLFCVLRRALAPEGRTMFCKGYRCPAGLTDLLEAAIYRGHPSPYRLADQNEGRHALVVPPGHPFAGPLGPILERVLRTESPLVVVRLRTPAPPAADAVLGRQEEIEAAFVAELARAAGAVLRAAPALVAPPPPAAPVPPPSPAGHSAGGGDEDEEEGGEDPGEGASTVGDEGAIAAGGEGPPEGDVFVLTRTHKIKALIRARAPELASAARTIDKAQGQEAPVVIVSYGAYGAPETLAANSHVLNHRRLNVAVSRCIAKCVLVISDEMLDPGLRYFCGGGEGPSEGEAAAIALLRALADGVSHPATKADVLGAAVVDLDLGDLRALLRL
eukprot:tig00000042_g15416.t1